MSKRQSTVAQIGANAIFQGRGFFKPTNRKPLPPRVFANSTKPVDTTAIRYAITRFEEYKYCGIIAGEVGILEFPNAITGKHFGKTNRLFGVNVPASAS